MRMPRSIPGILLSAATVLGCHTTYVVGRNVDQPDASSPGAAGSTTSGGGGGGGQGAAGSGGIMGLPGSGGAIATASGGGGGGDSIGSFSRPPALDAPPTPESAGSLSLQRLTLPELRNTLTDLLGTSAETVASALANAGFPDEASPSGGFLAPGTFSAMQTQALFSAAEQLTSGPTQTILDPCVAPAAGTDAITCATSFIHTFGRRAFRRPVTDPEATALLNLFNSAVGLGFDYPGSITQLVRAMLQSPNFLYHWEIGDAMPARVGALIPLVPFQIASRLSYLLWQTMPDETLLAAADNNQLSTPAQVLAQADRMLADARAATGLANFHRQWLRLDGLDSLQKDATLYPTFSPLEGRAFAAELSRFGWSVVMPVGDGTLRTLLTAGYTYQDNRDAAAIYGGAMVASDNTLPLDPTQRAGLLTSTAFLATDATPNGSDPLRRGVTVWQQLLCAPPIGSHPAYTSAPVDPMATSRDRFAQLYAQQSAPAGCVDCHGAFDPLGFAFENYDAIGAYRTMDSGRLIDPSGYIITPGGTTIAFRNAVALIGALAVNDEVKWCVTRQWFRFALGRMESGNDRGSMEAAYRAAAMVPGFSVRTMLEALVQAQTFRYRAPSPGEP